MTIIAKSSSLSREEQKLLDAARGGSVKAVRRLVGTKGVCIDVRNKQGNTPLLQASGRGHIEVVRVLLGAGAVVDAVNKK